MRAFDINITAEPKDYVHFKRNSRTGELRFVCQSFSGSESVSVFLRPQDGKALQHELVELNLISALEEGK